MGRGALAIEFFSCCHADSGKREAVVAHPLLSLCLNLEMDAGFGLVPWQRLVHSRADLADDFPQGRNSSVFVDNMLCFFSRRLAR
jgi:hypothetical protein